MQSVEMERWLVRITKRDTMACRLDPVLYMISVGMEALWTRTRENRQH